MEEDPACCVLAGGAMSKLATKLDGLLIRSPGRRRLSPIPWEVKNVLIPRIKQNVESMMAIIQEDGDGNPSKEVIRCLTKEVRELSYDIHDCIDEHAAGPARDHATRLLWRMERHVRLAKANDKRRRFMELARRRNSSKPVTSWLSERLKGRLWLLDKMRELSARSEEALRRYNSFNRPLKKQKNDDSDGSISSTATRSVESFGSWSPPPNDHVLHRCVGIHDLARNTLETWLTGGDSLKLKVVSMVGCGGVGKTTLANELYRGIGGQFQYRAFVGTSEKPDVRRLLISILSQIRPQQPPGNWKVHNLIGDIRTHLQDKRYLIVIDDIWARSTWDIVNRAFPDGNHCSRILITSELEDVALKCCGYEPQNVYKMNPLGEDDSRKLFYSIVGCSQELGDVSSSIIRKCGGLPLAIVTIASLLASRIGKTEQREYVEYVNKSLGYGLMTNPTLEGLKQVVSLSYRNLPQHLKACMLYLCIFPEDYIIWTDDLVRQWIAEGFICATQEKDEEEISRSYFDQLISIRLIHPIHIDGNGKVLSCTMHHMMRKHIMHESIVENFIAAIDHSQAATRFAHKVRRLSLHFGNAEDATLSTNMRLSQVRTFAFFGAFKCMPAVIKFRLLQVLILHFWGEEESIKFDLSSISEIFRLRYIQVTCNVTLEIQEVQMLRCLQYLETLKIDAARGSRMLSGIVHLPRLLHLRLPADTNLLSGVGHMTSLRTLGHFDLSTNSIDNVRDLGELTNVQDLQLTCRPVDSSCYLVKQMECLSSVLEKLNNLKSLTLKSSRVVELGRRPSSMSICCDVLSSISSPPALLQRLEWLPRVCTFSSLPEWIGHLGKLCVLKIGVRELVRNNVDLLKGLPALIDLSLYVRTKPAEINVFTKGGFLVLKYFRFRCSVPCLKFVADAMPNLQKLKLGFDADEAIQYGPICTGLDHLSRLKEISAKIGGEFEADIMPNLQKIELGFVAQGAIQYGLIPAGLHHLSGLKEISAEIGGASANEPVRRIVESALSDAIRMHPGRPTVNIQCVDQIFGEKDDQDNRLQEKNHMTPQKKSEPVEEDPKKRVTIQKGSGKDAASREISKGLPETGGSSGVVKLLFVDADRPKDPLFTGCPVKWQNGENAKVAIFQNEKQIMGGDLSKLQIEILPVHADFFTGRGPEDFTKEEFNKQMYMPKGKESVLTTVKLTNGEAYLGSFFFMESSYRKNLRLAARVKRQDLANRVQEAITDPFVVKNRRSELNEKSYHPSKGDPVYRLKKISQNGRRCNTLAGKNITTVKHLMRQYHVDKSGLQKLTGMKKGDWSTMIEHATTCDPGDEIFSYRVAEENCELLFNDFYDLVGMMINGLCVPITELDQFLQLKVNSWKMSAYNKFQERENSGVLIPDYLMSNGCPVPLNNEAGPSFQS
ncbi:hypothetical protein ACQ4PT_031073 [Festuca glaucescens]